MTMPSPPLAIDLPPLWRDLPRVGGPDPAIIDRPYVVRGINADWPLVAAGRAGPDALCTFLAGRANAAPVELWTGARDADGYRTFGYDPGVTGFAFDRRRAPLAQLCALLLRCIREAGAPALFAGAINLPAHLPDLEALLPMPLLPAEQERLVSLWIGTPSRTAAHWDRPANLACPVAGPRLFLLFPPDQVGNLYVGPLDLTPAGQPISLVDCARPDFATHPRFATALTHAVLAVLEPGDALYIPPLWFHHVTSPAPLGAQINFWWLDDTARLSPQSSLLHAILTLRGRPAAERAGWEALFRHYVFADPAEATAHLPPSAHGVLGRLSRDEERQLATLLTRQLASAAR